MLYVLLTFQCASSMANQCVNIQLSKILYVSYFIHVVKLPLLDVA